MHIRRNLGEEKHETKAGRGVSRERGPDVFGQEYVYPWRSVRLKR